MKNYNIFIKFFEFSKKILHGIANKIHYSAWKIYYQYIWFSIIFYLLQVRKKNLKYKN